LLAIHAAFCKVMHLSDTADYIDDVMWDMEEVRGLHSNGSSNIFATFVLHSM
jgi:hypothetical protein